jgi:hypothetical protein
MDAEFGMAWYRADQWDLLKGIVADPDVIEAPYDEWQQAAENLIKMMESLGVHPTKVPVDVTKLHRWCQKRGRALNAGARGEYVTVLQRQAAE